MVHFETPDVMLVIRGFTLFLMFKDFVYALTFLVLLIFAIPSAIGDRRQLLSKQRGVESEQAGYDDESLHGRSVDL
jgi:hypothetical protein